MAKAAKLAVEMKRHISENRLKYQYAKVNERMERGAPGAYNWQRDFHNAGGEYKLRIISGGNRTGKTETPCAEIAIHATGRYPDWWRGRTWSRGVTIWSGSVSSESIKSVAQEKLLGQIDGETGLPDGTGWIPKECIIGKPSFKKGVADDCVDTAKIRHASGQQSLLSFKSYEQGRLRWQGSKRDIVHMDEEPVGKHEEIFGEALMRTEGGGLLMLGFTSLEGITHLAKKVYKEGGNDSIHVTRISPDQCPHLDPDEMNSFRNILSKQGARARLDGEMMLGSGPLYMFNYDDVICDPHPVPDHWPRIAGIDFGIHHPTAVVWLAHDIERDMVVAYDEYQKSDEVIPCHASVIKSRGRWIPVAWPHDGHKRDLGSGVQYREQYAEQDVNMVDFSARYNDNDPGGKKDHMPVIEDVNTRARTERIKVFSRCRELIRQMRLYHQKNGNIQRIEDDTLSAFHYAMMMLRHAVTSQGDGLLMSNFTSGGYDPTCFVSD